MKHIKLFEAWKEKHYGDFVTMKTASKNAVDVEIENEREEEEIEEIEVGFSLISRTLGAPPEEILFLDTLNYSNGNANFLKEFLPELLKKWSGATSPLSVKAGKKIWSMLDGDPYEASQIFEGSFEGLKYCLWTGVQWDEEQLYLSIADLVYFLEKRGKLKAFLEVAMEDVDLLKIVLNSKKLAPEMREGGLFHQKRGFMAGKKYGL